MKALIMSVLFAATFSANAMAAKSTICYPFHPNQEGYTKLCAEVENLKEDVTDAEIEIYKNDKVAKTVQGQRVFSPQRQDCTTHNFCFRRYESLKILSKSSDLSGIKVDISLHRATNKCLGGTVTFNDKLELSVECPRRSWEEIN